MKDLLIYGAGGLGREVACLIGRINEISPTWNLVGFIDDGLSEGMDCTYGKVIGGLDSLNGWKSPIAVVLAVGSPHHLKEIPTKITNPLIEFPNIIAPNTFFFDKDSVTMGKGNIITFGCRFSCNIRLGSFNILDGCVSLGHDVEMGDCNMLFPEVRVSGQTVIGNKNYMGARTFVAQCLRIGNENRFGAGTYILRKIKDGGFYMGNPAKKIDIG